jgi:hypothetical protein
MYEIGPIDAAGAFTGDFGISADAPTDQIPGDIERDRAIMVQRPGLRQKHLPIHVDSASGRVFAGGRYLFDTYEDAEAYRRWVTEEFAVDGVPFPERSYFVEPRFFAWRVIGAHDYAPLETHTGIRLQRWSLRPEVTRQVLAGAWAGIRETAAVAGLASAWLLHGPERREAALVTITRRTASAEATREQGERRMSTPLDSLAVEKPFDRSDLVWTLWMPRAGEGQPHSLWPNSPPLPAPVEAIT